MNQENIIHRVDRYIHPILGDFLPTYYFKPAHASLGAYVCLGSSHFYVMAGKTVILDEPLTHNELDRLTAGEFRVAAWLLEKLQMTLLALKVPEPEKAKLKTKTKDARGWTLDEQFGRDMHPGRFVEAVCAHGLGHHRGVHGCDGCCPAPEDIWEKVSVD